MTIDEQIKRNETKRASNRRIADAVYMNNKRYWKSIEYAKRSIKGQYNQLNNDSEEEDNDI